jgi:prepilin-type N-terminal cleavage/methylation domain-containing protein
MFDVRKVHERGFTLIELMLAVAVTVTVLGMAVPVTTNGIESVRVAGATRSMASRIALARIDALRRSSTVALRFEPDGSDYTFTVHIDGNGNGVRTAEITSGVDSTVGPALRLRDTYSGVQFGLLSGLPDLDGVSGSQDGVRVGSSRILSLSPDGSCTSGTLYIRTARGQYAVRVLGATGRVRVFFYDPGASRWIAR